MRGPVDLFVFLELFLDFLVRFPLRLLFVPLILGLAVAQAAHLSRERGGPEEM